MGRSPPQHQEPMGLQCRRERRGEHVEQAEIYVMHDGASDLETGGGRTFV